MFCLWRATASIAPRHMFSHSVVQKSRRLWYSTQDSNGRFSPQIRPILDRYPALNLGLQTEKSTDFENATASLAPQTDDHAPKAHGSVPHVTATAVHRPAILRFGHGLSQSASRRPPNTPQSTFLCKSGPRRTPAKGIAQTVAKPLETCPPMT